MASRDGFSVVDRKFDVIVHQMILHQPCSLQEYVSFIAAEQDTHCRRHASSNLSPHLSRTSEPCKAVGEHGTGDHLIAHTPSPNFSKWERRTTQVTQEILTQRTLQSR